MMRRLILLPILLLIASLAVPASASAIIPPSEGGAINFPGRPMLNQGTCHGIAYGRVSGALVLFIPHHCRDYNDDGGEPGTPAYTNGGQVIGTWGGDHSTWKDDDLAYIFLNSTWSPTSGLNKIYRGNVSGSNYWTIDHQPTSSEGCGGYPLHNNYVHDNWQSSHSSSLPYGTGRAVGKDSSPSSGCFILTTSGWHNGDCCTSGVPFVADAFPGALAGYAVGSWNCEVWSDNRCVQGYQADLYYRPIYKGIEDLDTYWDNNYPYGGARLCIDSDC